MFKLVRHNQPQAWNFQKQPVVITELMDTEFQWQACSYMLQADFMISL